MFHASLQGAEMQSIRARFDQRVDSFFQKIEKRELISRARLVRDVEQRNRNRRWSWREIRNDLLVTDDFQDVAHGLRKLTERDHRLVVSQAQVKGNAFGHMIG